jgi:predicted Fe-S protein YdhL (DUF1289 family)
MPSPLSPCTRVCVIDPATGLCEGCGRTLDEIAGWAAMSDGDRLAIMARLEPRTGGASDALPAEAV